MHLLSIFAVYIRTLIHLLLGLTRSQLCLIVHNDRCQIR